MENSMNRKELILPFDPDVLDPVEKIIFTLRSLYRSFGYHKYRMSKFEEYDLYVRNKDDLVSEGIITFTDTTGKLMALKPDVTLSIIKNTRDVPGKVTRLCYDENVYRVSRSTGSYREIMQTGVECLGDVDEICTGEVLLLAAKSLEIFGRDYLVEAANVGILSALLDRVSTEREIRKKLIRCISEKNIHGLLNIAEEESLSVEGMKDLSALARIRSVPGEAFELLEPLCAKAGCSDELESMKSSFCRVIREGYENRIIIDFSVVHELRYYNGILFKGFLKGIPESVISGGQYDHLMKKMGKTSKAAGFAVYLDALDGQVI